MKCPIDATELVMSDRQGIEIDYCPKCRGVWLDRGELDKIIERSEPDERPRQSRDDDDNRYKRDNDDYGRGDDSKRGDDHGRGQRPYKKKKSILGELFDF